MEVTINDLEIGRTFRITPFGDNDFIILTLDDIKNIILFSTYHRLKHIDM